MLVRIVAFTSALLAAVPAPGATPAQSCQASKNKTAGKYDYCRQKAEAKYATTADGAARTAALQKCLDKYAAKWSLLETKATNAGGACPSVGDEATVQGFIDAHTTGIATALAGGPLPDCPTDLLGCQTDLAACQATQRGLPATGQTTCWDTSGSVVACAGTGHDGDAQAGGTLAYTDNGDGTITDENTGLVWEKLSDDGSIHDQDDTYTWDDAFAVKVATLNSVTFAGHGDWRVPNYKELISIIDLENADPAVAPALNTSCTSDCHVTTCSCTSSAPYWSSSTSAGGNPMAAWFVGFASGDGYTSDKTLTLSVRAVRGGL